MTSDTPIAAPADASARDVLRHRLAEAFWQDESQRISGKNRREPWSEIGDQAQMPWLRFADVALATPFPTADDARDLLKQAKATIAVLMDRATTAEAERDALRAEVESWEKDAKKLAKLMCDQALELGEAKARVKVLEEVLRARAALGAQDASREGRDGREQSDGK